MTTEDWRDVLGDGLMVTLDLPVSASERSLTPSESVVHLLDAIAVLEETPQAHGKDEAPSPEMVRLEMKIDLLMDLVTTLLADRIPASVSVVMSEEGCVLPSAILSKGADRLEIYPCQWLGQPIVLQLAEVRAEGEWCGATWASTDSHLRDALGRWVFRTHRRDVARRRMHSGGSVA